MERFIWWHRIRGHKITSEPKLPFGGFSIYLCHDCEIAWEKSWL